jgi:ATP-dependent RNA helicase DeaD
LVVCDNRFREFAYQFDSRPPGRLPGILTVLCARFTLPPRSALAPSSEKSASDSSATVPAFADLDLSETMMAALDRAAYAAPTPVQSGIIPRALEGVDVLGQARTGTGKTAAFAIPILERLKAGRKGAPPQALVLVPTRELAVQVRDEFEKLAHGRRVACVPIYGGKPIRGQIANLQRGADVIVGTPGRVLDHLARGSLDLRSVRTVVLDEADRMLDIGFRPDIEKILRRCPKERQTLLLSATVAPPIERLAQKYMRDPEVMDFSPKSMSVETIEQFYFTVDQERKFDLLVHLLKRDEPDQAIVFCRTKRGTERVFRRLSKHFEAVDMMHGDMQQSARDRVMKAFRARDVRVLVATDVVGRGIDVTSISHIINYDLPQSSDDYVHRVGRTGRMGREGVAYTFVTTEEGGELTRIEILINRLLKRDEIPGFAAVASLAAVGSTTAASAPSESPDSDGDTTDTPPAQRPLPPGRRPPKRHRRAL